MGEQESLRRLSRKLPSPPEIEKLLVGMIREPDLALAITAPALVEAELERLIVTHFKVKNKAFLNSVFLNRGPLSDFNSKILIAQAFGVISDPIADGLHAVRSIRNAFAHAKIVPSFRDEAIGKTITATDIFKKLQELDTASVLKYSHRTWFHLLMKIMLIYFDMMIKVGGTSAGPFGDIVGQPTKT